MLKTTSIDFAFDDNRILKGDEIYPLIGDYPLPIQTIWPKLSGLKRSWDCIKKAQIVQETIGKGIIAIGSLMVWSGDYKSQYGFHYNPPYELHVWVEVGKNIIDVALPGVIEKGLNTSDEIGPYLINREPFILAGIPPKFLDYRKYQIHYFL